MSTADDMLWRKSALITQIVAASAGIVRKAGGIVRSKAGTDLKAVQKGYKDFQTEADRASQTFIISNLRRQFGNDLCIIGEEDQDNEPSAEVAMETVSDNIDKEVLKQCEGRVDVEINNADIRDMVVWVDPLDGTMEFTEGLFDHVTVLIGVAVKGMAVGGIIHQPFYGYDNKQLNSSQWGRTIWGVIGVGTYGVTPGKPPDKRIIATTRSHSNKTVNAAIEAMQPAEVVRVGGAGYKVVLVIEGAVSAYVFASAGCKKWDTCGPDAVLTALGGKFTDVAGNTLRYHNGVQHMNSAGVLATPPGVDHQWFVDRIPPNVKDTLPPILY